MLMKTAPRRSKPQGMPPETRTESPEQTCPHRRLTELPASRITLNMTQPRTQFDPIGLQELALSIAQHGILQPLTVRMYGEPSDPRYVLIAGERRLRAAKMAGLSTVPCIVMEAEESEAALLSLVENLQRRDLDCFEEAQAYQKLIERFGLTQGEVAQQLGRSQPSVANRLRLLRFSEAQMALMRRSGLTERHARCILRLPPEQYDAVLQEAAEQQMTVAQLEKLVEEKRGASPTFPVPEMPPQTEKSASAHPAATPRMLVRDVRIFLNTIDRAVRTMQDAGMAAEMSREEAPEGLTLTIRIPRREKKR